MGLLLGHCPKGSSLLHPIIVSLKRLFEMMQSAVLKIAVLKSWALLCISSIPKMPTFGSCRSSKPSVVDADAEPASPSARPETPKGSEGRKKLGKQGSGKHRKDKQASPHSGASQSSLFENSRSSDQPQVHGIWSVIPQYFTEFQ